MPNNVVTFCFILFDGFSNMAFANALEPLRAARDLPTGPQIDWDIATINDQPVRSSSKITITPNIYVDDIDAIDYLIIISGYGTRSFATKDVFIKLHRLRKQAQYVVGIDSAAWLMASMGLLEDHKATIHWQEVDEFEENFPNVVRSKYRFAKSGVYFTCGGASSTLEMILDIIKTRFGPAVEFDVSNLFTYNAGRRSGVRELVEEENVSSLKSVGSAALRSAVDIMLLHIEQPISLEEIAKINSTSIRSLNRIFVSEIGMTPGKYYQLLRLTRARDLAVETRNSISLIAIVTGFSNASSLSRAFSAHYKMPISQIRKQSRTRTF